TKVLAYRELKPKSIFYIPVMLTHTCERVPYRLDRVFNLWKNMRAFGLVPVESRFPPILLFRGTDFSLKSHSSHISIISNFDPAGPGFSIYLHARSSIKRWLDRVALREKPIVMGYSLGGALASYALLKDGEYFSQLESSYLFNHPGFSEEAFALWKGLDEKKKPRVHAFVSDGDVVSKYGYLFDKTYGVKHTRALKPIKAHTLLLFLQPRVKTKLIDLDKENRCASRQLYSKLHKNTTNIFFNIGLKLFLPSHE
ncbi:MAG: DUF2974 domain-containing protein, partial [Rectinemataceae bacterium]|nr:DUF2974 domain-containing protein [Rectinemataceae bacterium]